jgi:hypothetical protein
VQVGSKVEAGARKTPTHWGAGTFGFCSSALMSLVSGFASAACFFICSHGAYARARAGHVCDRVWSGLVQGQGAKRRGSRKGGKSVDKDWAGKGK